jgi:NADP-dependent 3-hydroxy acid dehydrogenase YdfG
MESLKGKQVLLAGATGSIGSQTARLLAQGGARLFLAGRNQDKLASLAASLPGEGHQYFVWDACDEESCRRMADSVKETAPQIDILINASGIGIIKSMDSLSLDEFRRSLDVNLIGAFLLLKYFLPAMKEAKKGLIINIPGVLGKTPMAGAAAYSASKYGLMGMMQSVREELKRTEIRITNIFLGGVDSNFWDTIDLRVQREKMIRAEEAARAIWFLCQQPASGVVSEMVLQPFNHQAI